MSGARRLEMIRHHPDLSLACQCALPRIHRWAGMDGVRTAEGG